MALTFQIVSYIYYYNVHNHIFATAVIYFAKGRQCSLFTNCFFLNETSLSHTERDTCTVPHASHSTQRSFFPKLYLNHAILVANAALACAVIECRYLMIRQFICQIPENAAPGLYGSSR